MIYLCSSSPTRAKSLESFGIEFEQKSVEFDEDDLQRYIDSNLWQGKAGACMVEGFCKPYIQEVARKQSCAMGLSVEVLLPWIDGVG